MHGTRVPAQGQLNFLMNVMFHWFFSPRKINPQREVNCLRHSHPLSPNNTTSGVGVLGRLQMSNNLQISSHSMSLVAELQQAGHTVEWDKTVPNPV